MGYMNTNKSLLLLADGAVLPTTSQALELQDPLIVNPNPTVETFKRITGKLGTEDSYADTCDVTISETITHKMRHSNTAGTSLETPPEYGELLKISGMKEVVDSSTPGQETVTYTNTQTPTKGSAVIYLDGKKFTLTDTLVADTTMTFEIGKSAMISGSISGFYDNKGIPTNEANPSVTLSDEPCLIVSCADIITAGGTALSADSITISIGADIQKFYAFNTREFTIQDYAIKVTADFYVDNANYADAITKLNNQTIEAIDIKLGTDGTGALISGKSVHVTASLAKAGSSTDSDNQQRVKRSFTWNLQLDGSDEALQIIHGYFA